MLSFGIQTTGLECTYVHSEILVRHHGYLKPEDIPLEPFQPKHIAFPSRSFGKSAPMNRSFQATWFNKFGWLYYDVTQDAARCFTCCKKKGYLSSDGSRFNLFHSCLQSPLCLTNSVLSNQLSIRFWSLATSYLSPGTTWRPGSKINAPIESASSAK